MSLGFIFTFVLISFRCTRLSDHFPLESYLFRSTDDRHGARESFVTLVWYRLGVPPLNGVYWQAWIGWQATGNGLNGLGFLTFRFDLCSFFTNLRLCSLPLELVVLIDQWTLFDGVKWFWRCMRCLFVLYGLYNRSLKCHPPSLRSTPKGYQVWYFWFPVLEFSGTQPILTWHQMIFERIHVQELFCDTWIYA